MVGGEPASGTHPQLLPAAMQVHFDALRRHLDGAVCGIALETQRLVFRNLSEITIAAPVGGVVAEALYRSRQVCLAFLSELERGSLSTDKRLLALTSVDLLEAALLLSCMTDEGHERSVRATPGDRPCGS